MFSLGQTRGRFSKVHDTLINLNKLYLVSHEVIFKCNTVRYPITNRFAEQGPSGDIIQVDKYGLVMNWLRRIKLWLNIILITVSKKELVSVNSQNV